MESNLWFVFDGRAPQSPFIETIYHTESDDHGGRFISTAATHWEIVFTQHDGRTSIAARGPETIASIADTPINAEFLGIVFPLGTFMPDLPVSDLVDGGLMLPDTSSRTFNLNGASWEIPSLENADVFVQRLARQGLLVHDPIVRDALRGHFSGLSLRSVQRRFLRATGITQGTMIQIERARQAAILLEQGVSILDVVDRAGFADQPHLTRSLKRFLGQTPAQLLREPTPRSPQVIDWSPLLQSDPMR